MRFYSYDPKSTYKLAAKNFLRAQSVCVFGCVFGLMCIKSGGSESLNYTAAEAVEVKTLSAAFNPQLVRRMNVYHKVQVDGIKCREVCALYTNVNFGFAS